MHSKINKIFLFFNLLILCFLLVSSRYGNIEVANPRGDLCEMFISDNAAETTINTINVWEEINGFSSSEMKGCTITDSDITINTAGVYIIRASISTSTTVANKIYQLSISVDDVVQTKY